MEATPEPLEVWCRSDGRYAEKPLGFRLGERALRVERVIAQSRTPEAEFFTVACNDGAVYRLAHYTADDFWRLETLPLGVN